MRSISIKALNSKLSACVQRAASGETILITDRDQDVTKLGPINHTQTTVPADAFLSDLVRSGVITPPLTRSSTPPSKPPTVGRFDEIMGDLEESRDNR